MHYITVNNTMQGLFCGSFDKADYQLLLR